MKAASSLAQLVQSQTSKASKEKEEHAVVAEDSDSLPHIPLALTKPPLSV